MDIAARLRSTLHTGGALIGPEAADEIERLRTEVEFWRTTAKRAIENTDKALAIIELQKAVQND